MAVYNRPMIRVLLLLLVSTGLCQAGAGVDIETAAGVYQAASIRDQVRPALRVMPARMRQLFVGDGSRALTDAHLAAVEAGAVRGFRIDVFEPPALQALAAGLDAPTARDSLKFLGSAAGRRMVAADIAAAQLDEATAGRVASGDITTDAGAAREALLDRLAGATRSLDTAVQVYLTIARGLAVGTAIGGGRDPVAAADTATRSVNDQLRAEIAQNMREPLRRSLAYGYRDLSTADLNDMLAFFRSRSGERYVVAYQRSMNAGFEAMSQRCGEHIGEAWRELAQVARNAR